MNLSSGGLSILAIAAIWFLVFLPSFTKAERKKLASQGAKEKVKAVTQNRLGENAKKALNARRSRTTFAAIAGVSFVIAGLSFLELVSNGEGLPLTIGSVLTTALATWLTYRAHVSYRGLLTGTFRRSVPISTSTSIAKVAKTETPQNTWQPEALPKQSFLQTGAIEVVELAEVVELEAEKAAEDIRIDEILRRRRHHG